MIGFVGNLGHEMTLNPFLQGLLDFSPGQAFSSGCHQSTLPLHPQKNPINAKLLRHSSAGWRIWRNDPPGLAGMIFKVSRNLLDEIPTPQTTPLSPPLLNDDTLKFLTSKAKIPSI
jgi:hypothetical protein